MFERKAKKKELQDKIIKEMKIQVALFAKLHEVYRDESWDNEATNEENIKKDVYLQLHSILGLFAQKSSAMYVNTCTMCVNTKMLQMALDKLNENIPVMSKDRALVLIVKDFLKSVANTLILIFSFGQHSGFFSTSMQPLHEVKSALGRVLKSVETLEKLNASNEPSAEIVFSAL